MLPIEGADVILGISWLSTLGRIILDYKHLTMQFESDGHMVELRGEQSALKGTIKLHSLRRLTNANGLLGCFALTLTENELLASVFLPYDLQVLLARFADVFRIPTGFSSAQPFDHAIHLQLGSALVLVRPYRYPYFQKTEIERLAKEMLDEGIMGPSTSTFSSLVLLVKKGRHMALLL